jgi:hypothetical protein
MFPPPPPEPNEMPSRRLPAPAAIFLEQVRTPEADRLAQAILDARPGALIIAPPR